MSHIIKLVREEIVNLTAHEFSSAAFISNVDSIRLLANENLYGCSPKAKAALENFSEIHLYGNPNLNELRDLISKYTNLEKEYIREDSSLLACLKEV